MNELVLLPIGEVEEVVMAWTETIAAEWFPFPVRRLPPAAVPDGSWDEARRQHRAVEFLKLLVQQRPPAAARILGVTACDLSIPLLTFLYGQAQLDGPAALVSICRLRQEFYGLPSHPELLRERLAKEVLHEMGHTFGLTHCSREDCAMSLSTHIERVDAKRAGWCASCTAHIARRFTTPTEVPA